MPTKVDTYKQMADHTTEGLTAQVQVPGHSRPVLQI